MVLKVEDTGSVLDLKLIPAGVGLNFCKQRLKYEADSEVFMCLESFPLQNSIFSEIKYADQRIYITSRISLVQNECTYKSYDTENNCLCYTGVSEVTLCKIHLCPTLSTTKGSDLSP